MSVDHPAIHRHRVDLEAGEFASKLSDEGHCGGRVDDVEGVDRGRPRVRGQVGGDQLDLLGGTVGPRLAVAHHQEGRVGPVVARVHFLAAS